MDLEALAGSLRLCAALSLLTAAARRWTPLLLPTKRRCPAELFLRICLVATVFCVTTVALAGAVGHLHANAFLLVAALLYAAAIVSARSSPAPRFALGRRWRLAWPLVPALALVAVDLALFLPASPVNWDAMTYHLYFPARWIQVGRLFHIPTVFSDNSAAFAPQNGALFFAWQMALLGSDATCNVAQLLFLAFLAAALYRLALGLGLRRQGALAAAATLFWVAPFRHWAYTANVDVVLAACWTGALYWSLDYAARRERGSLVACALATGLAAGTKTMGLPLAILPAAVIAVAALRGKRYLDLATFAVAATVAGGWWYLKNLWLYGNPLFPLDSGAFRGVYGTDALAESLFRIGELGEWSAAMRLGFGNATWVLLLAGLLGLVRLAFDGGGRRRAAALGLAGFAVLWAAYVYAVVPHNNQSRFLLPVVVPALLGWARCLEPRRTRAVFYLAGLGAAAWASRPDLDWAYQLDRLAATGVGPAGPAALLGVAVLWFGWSRARRRRLTLLAWISVWPALALAADHAGRSRIGFLADADYRVWSAGYLMFNDPALEPRRIAYSGFNVPYALMGPGWKHHASYCNTQGDEGDGLYDYWSREPRLHSVHKPGIYRGDDNSDVWWACLESRRIDTVVILATIPVERPRHWRLSGDFPIERDWMRRRPEFFEPVLVTAKAEIYRVKRE